MKEFSDLSYLLQEIKAGNQQAYQYVVHQELPWVFNLSLRLCRNRTEAEDLTQDVFVKAIKSLSQFHGQSKISTWLYTVTINTWKNKVRSDVRHHKHDHVSVENNSSDEPFSINESNLVDRSPGPEMVLESKEISNTIFLALDQLSEEDKAIIVLRDVHQLSYEDIMKILKLNMGTVKSKLSRARENLRKKWSVFR